MTEGHPDKIADQISDALLDAFLSQDPASRVACETLVSIGYSRSEFGIDGHTYGVLTTLDQQSPEIAQGVDTAGAGDQGMMFGYAPRGRPR